MLYNIKIQAFTLVELIVVITILSILWTIGFISLQWFAVSARDSARLSDINTISRGLEYYQLETGRYPDPDDSVEFSNNWNVLWIQWTFWEEAKNTVQRVSEIPLDPVYKTQYQYAVTQTRREFELAALMEKQSIFWVESSIFTQIHADNPFSVYSSWNYNKKYISDIQNGNIQIFWVPTLITNTNQATDISSLISQNNFSLPGWNNLPAVYAGKLKWENSHTWTVNFIPGSVSWYTIPLVYSWSLQWLSWIGGKVSFWTNLRDYYVDSNASSINDYNSFRTYNTQSKIVWFVNSLIQSEKWWLNTDLITISEIIDVSSVVEASYPANTFVSIWDSLWTSTLTIPVAGWGANYNLYYEKITDKTQTWSLTWLTAAANINLPSPWKYRIEITWNMPQHLCNSNVACEKIESVIQWWNVWWTSAWSSFFWATNLLSVPNNTIWLESVTNMSQMFRNASSLNSNLSAWNLWSVTNTSNMFFWATAFNWDVSWWNMWSVVNMSQMFRDAASFNSSLSAWNIANATNTSWMFFAASNFNSDLSSWNLTNVTNTSQMFRNAVTFTSDLSNWNVSNVTNMSYMFNGTTLFTSDLSSWNVWKVTNMLQMFRSANNFNSNLSTWNVINVTNMYQMFFAAVAFSSDLSSWNVSKVTSMQQMFRGATIFSSNLSWWNVAATDVANNYDFDYNTSWLTADQYPIW